MSQIEVSGGIELIRRHPELYFLGGAVTAAAISSYLVDDALMLGASRTRVDFVEPWHIIAADIDWLRLPAHPAIPLERLFRGMHAHPTRVNGIRSEVFVGAFSDAAYVSTPKEIRSVIGDSPLPKAVRDVICVAPYLRGVAFVFATANNASSGRDT